MAVKNARPCYLCRHRRVDIVFGDVCAHADGRNPETQRPLSIKIVRSPAGFCKPTGLLWQPRNTPSGDDLPPVAA